MRRIATTAPSRVSRRRHAQAMLPQLTHRPTARTTCTCSRRLVDVRALPSSGLDVEHTNLAPPWKVAPTNQASRWKVAPEESTLHWKIALSNRALVRMAWRGHRVERRQAGAPGVLC